MKKVTYWLLSLVLCMGFTAAKAQTGNNAQPSNGQQRSQDRITREVHHELVMLPQLTIFDNLQYQVNGNEVTLKGEVVHGVLKGEAQDAVKKIEGVEKVNNQIDILPPSPMDNRIRLAVAHALFGNDSPLFRYAMGALPPIHIIVKSGHVTLEGVVDSESDKNLAYTKANGVPGVFSVTNNLVVQKS
ncbi:MAG TPA: BON domain-containing protein [Candidatus Angelobacter sp.]|nr:BON domain-containing protein [Candidatus Angelobacter sp.]